MHATRHFLVTCETDGGKSGGHEREKSFRLLLWLFVDSLSIALSPDKLSASVRGAGAHAAPYNPTGAVVAAANVATSASTARLHVCKVLFRIADDTKQSAESQQEQQQAQAWTQPGTVEPLSYPPSVCTELRAALEAANRAYPPPQRAVMGGMWHTAFLALE